MHDSFTPIGGMVPLFNMQTDEVIFGGVGCWALQHVALRDFGRIHRRFDVGRTPEYVGKKIEKKEVKNGTYCHSCDFSLYSWLYRPQLGLEVCE